MTSTEQWLPVPGFEGSYEVSSLGRVRSLARTNTRGGLRALHLNPDGYLTVGLHHQGRKSTRKVHSLVALAFHGPRPVGTEVRHLDGEPLNNRSDNLAYGTRSENQQDRVRHGTHTWANRTHCPREHPYTEENTRFTRSGARYCLTCKREKRREQRAAARA